MCAAAGTETMPEAASAEATPETAAPASALDQIDALMADALDRANATEDTTETPPTEADSSSTPGSQAAEEPQATPAEDTSDAQAASVEADQEAPTQDTPTAKPPSRREAARLQEQLLAAEQRNRDLQTQLEQRTAVDTQVRQKYADRLGSPQEKANLEAILANPRANFQDVDRARTRLGQMRAASEELAPIHQSIEQNVLQNFVRGIDSLRSLEGMDEAAHQALYKAPDGVTALRQMYDVGRKAALAEAQGEIGALKASLSELRTKQVARTNQPASGTGTSAPTGALAGLIGADGLPTDEAIERARSGALRTLGAS